MKGRKGRKGRAFVELAVLSASVVLMTSCFSKPPLRRSRENALFTGCFSGPVTSIGSQPNLVLVFQPPSDMTDLTVTGCLALAVNPPGRATFAGEVRANDATFADIMTTPVGGSLPVLDLLVQRQPVDGPAATLSVSSADSTVVAPSLQPCSETCASLGVPTP